MASSSSASSSYLPNTKSSRFSTLKAFKFGSKEKELKPPPLPPKDPYYLRNRSLASLSPDAVSLAPHSPLSLQSSYPYPRQPSPDPSRSTLSLTSSAASMKSSPPPDQRPDSSSRQPKKERGLSFLKFGRRSPRSPPSLGSSAESGEPQPPGEDEGISLPWNFQHNIHVDEGYVGLPPSWAVSLAEAGFSEDEIAAIQARRAGGSRSPGSQYLYTDRPDSPSTTNPYNNTIMNISAPMPPPVAPVLMHPKPRSTSLSRQYSDASLKAMSQQVQEPSPPVPPLKLSTSAISLQSSKGSKSNGGRVPPPRRRPPSPGDSTHYTSSSVSVSVESHQGNVPPSAVEIDNRPGTSVPTVISSLPSPPPLEASKPPAIQTDPVTPSRRVFHVANKTPPKQTSPPPAYGYTQGGYRPDKKEKSSPAVSSTSIPTQQSLVSSVTTPYPITNGSDASESTGIRGHRPSASGDTTASRSTTSSEAETKASTQRTPNRVKRTTALPPRLSLHKSTDSADLSMWSEALLSGISSGKLDNDNYSSEGNARRTPSPQQRSRADVMAGPSEPERSVDRARGYSPSDDGRESPAPPTGWAEPSQTARYSPVSPTGWQDHSPSPVPSPGVWSTLESVIGNDNLDDDELYSAALTESYSPILPFNPASSGAGVEVKALNVSKASSSSTGHPPTLSQGYEDECFLHVDNQRERTNRDSSRSSSSTLSTSTVTGLTAPTVVRNVSIARRTGAYVIHKPGSAGLQRKDSATDAYGGISSSFSIDDGSIGESSSKATIEVKHPPSPLSSHFGSEEESGSGSTSSSSQSQDHPTPTTDGEIESPLLYYLDGSHSPGPTAIGFSPASRNMKLTAVDPLPNAHKHEGEMIDGDYDLLEGDDDTSIARRPTIVISDAPTEGAPLTSTTTPGNTPLSPYQKYRGWLSEIVAPLEEFIDETVDPREHYLELQEIAEGESGSVFAARLSEKNAFRLKLPPLIKAKDGDSIANGHITLVAIKSVAIVPSGSPKLVELKRELALMRGLWHENVLGMDAVYVDLVEDSLWIRMELMERSLTDVVALVADGLMLQDRMIARFASDVLNALGYLQRHNIAHRDIRSDNLLLNSHGVLKLTDFSNAVQVTRESPMRSDPAGVVYWQAPEMRTPPYNALKVDVWSLGATVWEMAQTEPPFSDTQQFADRWPPLRQPDHYSPAFHDFLRRCSEPAASRPDPSDLMKGNFIGNACGRPVIVQLLSQCVAIERALQGDASQGPISE